MSTASVVYKTRRLLGDFGIPFTQQMTGDGVTAMFELGETTVEPRSITVQVSMDNGQTWAHLQPGTDFAIDSPNGVLLLSGPAQAGEQIAARGIAYLTWADTDIIDFVEIAFLQHTHHRNPPVMMNVVNGSIPPTLVLPAVEENLVATLAVVEGLWAEATAKSKNFTIDTGDGTVIPLAQQYQQIMQHIEKLMARYEYMANLLGVGLYAIEVFNQRRKSRITGTLVPEYRDQELEERYMVPVRELPNIPVLADVSITYRGIYNPLQHYHINDEVIEGGTAYVAVAHSYGMDPATDVDAGTGWCGLHWKKSRINEGGYWSGYAW